MLALTLATVFVLMTIGTAVAKQHRSSHEEYFMFWNNCAPVGVAVYFNGERVSSDDSLERAATSRLRSARLFRPGGGNGHLKFEFSQHLHDHVQTVLFMVRFTKLVRDNASGVQWVADTWSIRGIGHNITEDKLLGWLSRAMDEFIDDYLRVNESACEAG